MSYLEIVKMLEQELSEGAEQSGPPEAAPLAGSAAVSEHPAGCEKGELSEKSHAPNGLSLGSPNGRRRLVLRSADIPELERQLRLLGWHVVRRGVELHCT